MDAIYAEDRTAFADLLQRARVSAEAVTSTIPTRPRERARDRRHDRGAARYA